MKAGEAVRHGAAAEEGAQLLLDEARQPRAATARADLGEEGLEVLAHHALQHAVLGMAAHAGVPAAAGCRPADEARPSRVDRHGMPAKAIFDLDTGAGLPSGQRREIAVVTSAPTSA
ncbi:MAG: hypothetical protein U0802_11280 [Candidatus Binatia bacterium]